MRGEIGSELNEVVISKPYYRNESSEPSYDLQLVDKNGEFLYICGDNNIPKLLQNALRKYYKNKRKGDK